MQVRSIPGTDDKYEDSDVTPGILDPPELHVKPFPIFLAYAFRSLGAELQIMTRMTMMAMSLATRDIFIILAVVWGRAV